MAGLVSTLSERFATPKLRETFRRIAEGLGILCLAERPDNLLMWAHYADHHRGLVIGFDRKNHFFNRKRSANDEFYHLRQVKYSKERPQRFLRHMDAVDVFLTKSEEWAYESEWRMAFRSLIEMY
jgi:hypothetical protein